MYGNWYENAPYTELDGPSNLKGLIPTMLSELMVEACGTCKPYGQSKIHFFTSKTGESPQKETELDLKNSISSHVDASFPIYGDKFRKVLVPESLYTLVIPSPGCSIVVRDSKRADTVNRMIFNVLKVWPLLLVSYCIATLFGFLIWFSVRILSIFIYSFNE